MKIKFTKIWKSASNVLLSISSMSTECKIVKVRKLAEQTSCRHKIDIGNQCLTHLFAFTSKARPTKIDGIDTTYITM